MYSVPTTPACQGRHPLAGGGMSFPHYTSFFYCKHFFTKQPHGLMSASAQGPSDTAEG